MTQTMRMLGWLNADQPAIQKDEGQHEFRVKLSEVPSSKWKARFVEVSKDQFPRATVEQDVMVLSCELNEIGNAIEKVKQWFRRVNELLVRHEREADERVALQMREAQDKRQKVLAAVKGISFDEA